jgi:cytochrome c551/c552
MQLSSLVMAWRSAWPLAWRSAQRHEMAWAWGWTSPGQRRCSMAVVLLALSACGGGHVALPPTHSITPDELFNWAERQYPALFPAGEPATPTLRSGAFVYRHYPATGLAIGVADGHAWGQGGLFGPRPWRLAPVEAYACEVRFVACTAPVVERPPQALRVPEGELAQFSVGVRGGPSLNYEWQRNGQPIAWSFEPRLSLRTTAQDQGALFGVRISNARGNVTSAAVRLSLAPPVNLAAARDLAQANNCQQCHNAQVVGTGPAWRDVAGRYVGQADAGEQLAHSIRTGSAGVWNGFMQPFAHLTEDEAMNLAYWVLRHDNTSR